MNKTTAENIYIFIKNDKRLNNLLITKNNEARELAKRYRLFNIKQPKSFYEVYVPFIQKYIILFIIEQREEFKDPYSFPAQKEIVACAKIFASEAINER